jgi:phosphate transport system permease protein
MKEWWKSGAPWIWLNGGAVTISMIMVFGLLLLILVRGFGNFWPHGIFETTYMAPGADAPVRVVGELRRSETLTGQAMRDAGVDIPEDQALVVRHLVKMGNRDVTGKDFGFFIDDFMGEWRYPEDIAVLERREWGDFLGVPVRLQEEGTTVAVGDELWPEFQQRLRRSTDLFDEIRGIERGAIGNVNFRIERVRLDERRADLRGTRSPELEAQFQQRRADLQAEYRVLEDRLNRLYAEAARDSLVLRVADGQEVTVRLADIVKAWQPNNMSVLAKIGFYVQDFFDFIFGYPREANTEGGIFPAIFGTVVMVLVMSIIVTPFGVLAAIYLREYAKQGALLKTIRISVYNLAGVPSIVFGVFGLGFFVYFVGGRSTRRSTRKPCRHRPSEPRVCSGPP